jgi:hypothetical protein
MCNNMNVDAATPEVNHLFKVNERNLTMLGKMKTDLFHWIVAKCFLFLFKCSFHSYAKV